MDYHIKGDICYAKSFITFFKLHEDFSSFSSNYFFDLSEFKDLKCINVKENNEQKKRVSNSDGSHKLELDINLERKEYFYTVEYDYSFKLRNKNNNSYVLNIGHNQIAENGYFQLFIKFENKLKSIGFSRHVDYTWDKDYDFIIKTAYRHIYDGYAYNTIFF